jgi:cell division GTPase FtsZ
VVGISDIIVQPGLINVDFADVRSVLENAGTALMGIGSANGHQRATLAAERAVRLVNSIFAYFLCLSRSSRLGLTL